MPEEYEESEGGGELNTPPAFFPNEFTGSLREPGSMGELVETQVEGVYQAEDTSAVSRFVLLTDGERRLPILIGPFEAQAISLPLEGSRPDRPMSHDLLHNVITKLDGTVDRVVIDDLWNGIYYAKIYVERDGVEIELDARPSDAIAVAVRFDAAILVADGIFEASFES
jgi:bifunctional DNase/RNase